jgi:transcriptional regulator with XRE-family HTH domain
MPPSYLSKIENGTRRLDVVELIQIASAIGADAAEIMREVQESLSGPAFQRHP